MTLKRPRSNAEWLADLVGDGTNAEALADLREDLLRAVLLYLDRHRDDLADYDRRELEHLAQDCTQEALLQILGTLGTFRGQSKFTTWAYCLAISVASGELRLRRWRALSFGMLTSERVAGSKLLRDGETPEPETIAARSRILDAIGEIIADELTEQQRFAVINVHFGDVPAEEVAQVLDSTPNAIYKLLHEARKAIKRGLRQRRYSEHALLAAFQD